MSGEEHVLRGKERLEHGLERAGILNGILGVVHSLKYDKSYRNSDAAKELIDLVNHHKLSALNISNDLLLDKKMDSTSSEVKEEAQESKMIIALSKVIRFIGVAETLREGGEVTKENPLGDSFPVDALSAEEVEEEMKKIGIIFELFRIAHMLIDDTKYLKKDAAAEIVALVRGDEFFEFEKISKFLNDLKGIAEDDHFYSELCKASEEQWIKSKKEKVDCQQ